jgi:nucleotide-binding universal stress UspA family protein
MPGEQQTAVAGVDRPEASVQALREAARHARLLVVGHRGHCGFARPLLRPVARAEFRYTSCLVAVIR